MKQKYCVPGTLCFMYPLEKRKVIKKTLMKGGGLIAIGLILALIIVSIKLKLFPSEIVNLFSGLVYYILLADILVFSLLIIPFISEILYFSNYFYDIKENGLLVRKGVITKHEALVPFDKIQDIFVDQDLLDKIFGLYDLHIATAGFGTQDIHIDGINATNAEALKEIFLSKTGKKK
ncbi:MAG: PH domain-containing protein [Candidatus Micrarchaeia archaeon]